MVSEGPLLCSWQSSNGSILSQMNPSTHSHPISLTYDIILPSMPRSSQWSPSFRFSTKILHAYLTHSYYIPHSSHPPWFDHPNYTWWRVQLWTSLLCSSPASFHFTPLTAKYFSQYPVLKHPQFMLFI
jgi:hypothetical protein